MLFLSAFLGSLLGTSVAFLGFALLFIWPERKKPGPAVGLKVTAGPITSQSRKKV